MLKSMYEYKRWANNELMTLGIESRQALPFDDYRTFVRILNHTQVVDRIFAAHLQGQPHTYVATNTDETPELADLKDRARALDEWYLSYVADLTADQLAQVLKFRFADGDPGGMSRHEILQHLIVHGAYHRGAAGRILAAHGIQPPRDSLSVFWHQTQPERRDGA